VNQALYRRYRPENFGEVIGQEHVTEPLSQALRKGSVSHAYLFSGPRGCGKTTSARILARCLNCAVGPTPEPCGGCDSCLELGRGGAGSLDVEEIDAASHGGVDDARELRERTVYAPARDKYKVFILDEAHMVTPQGFNAMLKVVEEPPLHVKFVFATTEPEKVLPTIRSRSHHYPFRLVAPGLMTDYMKKICRSESIEVEDRVLSLVVKAGGGSVRDTESVLDQLMAGSVDSKITYQGAIALLGYTPSTLLEQMVTALGQGDGATVFSVVEQVVESGQEPRRFAEDLLERLRDLLVAAASGEQAAAALRSVPPDQFQVLLSQANALGLKRLSLAADAIGQGLAAMMGATSPRLQLELMVARALVRIEGVPGSSAPAIGQASTQPASPAPAPSAPRPSPPSRPVTASTPVVARPAAPPQPTAPEPGQTKAAAKPSASPSRRPFVEWDVDRPTAPPAAPVTAAQDNSAKPAAWPPAGSPVHQVAAVPESSERDTISQGGVNLVAVRAAWPAALAELNAANRVAGPMASQYAHVESVAGSQVVLGFNHPALGQRFARSFLGQMSQALSQALGQPVTVQVQDKQAAEPSPVSQVPAAAAREEPAPASPPAPPKPRPLATGVDQASPPIKPPPAPPTQAAAPSGPAPPAQPPTNDPGMALPLAAPAPPVASASSEIDLPGEAEEYAGSAGVRGLTGISLIEQMLGGEVINEIDPADDTQ